MESLPTLYEAAQLYAFFSLVTSLSIAVINARLLWLTKPFEFSGNVSYMITTLVVSFLFAPMFFFILLFFGEIYKKAVFASLINIKSDK
jgi:hypothetical protein